MNSHDRPSPCSIVSGSESASVRPAEQRSALYYWGVNGLLIGLTMYRPAYSAPALRHSILNRPAWIWGWSIFMLVSPTESNSFHEPRVS